MRNEIYLILISAFVVLIVVSSVGKADIVTPPLECNFSDSNGGVGFTPDLSCDQYGQTFWETTNSAYPHWLVVNLTSGAITNFTVSSFIVLARSFGEQPVNWMFQIWNGSSWNTYQTFSNQYSCVGGNQYNEYILTNPVNITQFRLMGDSSKCGGNFMHIAEIIVFKTTIVIPSFIVPATISVIGWLLGLIALALFIFGAWKFPLSIFVSGIVTIFLGLQLFSETHSIIISSFVWLLGIFVILFGIWRVKGDLD